MFVGALGLFLMDALTRISYAPFTEINLNPLVGEDFRIHLPQLEKENHMLPHTTGDILDILTGLFGQEEASTRRMHDHIRAKLCTQLAQDGLELVWDEITCRYTIASNPDREVGR